MKQYLDMVRNVLEYGTPKTPVRVGPDGVAVKVENNTIGLPNVIFSHEMSDGFPLLTTKRMPIKLIAVELEGFIHGITDKKWYQERSCRIWDEWANPEAVAKALPNAKWDSNYHGGPPSPHESEDKIKAELKKQVQAKLTDLGPIYGYQWRNFDKHYGERNFFPTDFEYEANGTAYGTDQLKYVADTLRSNPTDRRMVVSAWNPNQKHLMALPPCHMLWGVVVYDGKLNLYWVQRSCDLMLGVPFNIASYGLLLMLLAKHAGLEPGNLTGLLADNHIYENQIQGAREQITRDPRPLPKINILQVGSEQFDIFKWTHKDLVLADYNPHGKIDFGAVTV